MSYVLAVDYGTSYTCAAISADGQTETLRFGDGAHLPSQVFLEQDGRLLIGRAAGRAAARALDRFERSPKTFLGTEGLVLGEALVDPEEAVAAVLREVMEVALRHENGRAPAEVRLTHPARWGNRRKQALLGAAARAGISAPRLISEPEAAIHHFAHSRRVSITAGDLIAVYDLGGGTFDTAVLRCTGPDAFELAGPTGGTAGDEDTAEIGGDLFDRHVYEYCGRQIAEHDRAVWIALRRPGSRDDRQAQRQLLEDARDAKERLSSETTVPVWVARTQQDLIVTREQLDAMIDKGVTRSIAILDDTLTAAGVRSDQLSALYLTGGSSRIPLIYDRVLAHFGRADTQDDPKAIVALGAARMDPPPAPAEPEPVIQAPAPPPRPPVRRLAPGDVPMSLENISYFDGTVAELVMRMLFAVRPEYAATCVFCAPCGDLERPQPEAGAFRRALRGTAKDDFLYVTADPAAIVFASAHGRDGYPWPRATKGDLGYLEIVAASRVSAVTLVAGGPRFTVSFAYDAGSATPGSAAAPRSLALMQTWVEMLQEALLVVGIGLSDETSRT